MLEKTLIPSAVTLIILTVFITLKTVSTLQIASLENNLSDINIEKITQNHQTYSIQNGRAHLNNKQINTITNSGDARRVLTLANFLVREIEDPLLTSDELLSDDFENTLNLQEEIQKKFIDEKLLNQQIYPTNLFRKLVEVHKAKKLFLENISPDNAQKLIASYKDANSEYLSNINSLQNYYTQLANSRRTSRYVSLNTTSSANIITNDLEKIKKNAEAVSEEIKSREKCLQNSECPKRDVGTNNETPKIESVQSPTLLTDSELVTSQYQGLPKQGPFLIKTRCFGDLGQTRSYPFYAYHSKNGLRNTEYKTLFIKRADEVYFRKLNNLDPIDRVQISKGAEWNWFGESNPYACNDLGYQTTIASIVYFKETYKEPIIKNINGKDDLLASLAFEEEKFYKLEVISDVNYQSLSKIYYTAYQYLVSKKVTEKTEPLKKELLKRYLVTDRNLGNFTKIINQSLYTLETNLVRDKTLLGENTVNKDFFLDSFLSSRMQYSLTYFPFTKNVWRLNDSLKFIENENLDTTVTEKTYITLTKAKENYSDTEIRSWYVPVLDQIKSFNEVGN